MSQVLARRAADDFLAAVIHYAAANFAFIGLRSLCPAAGLVFSVAMRASDFAGVGAAHAYSRYSLHSTHSYKIETLPSVST